MKTGSNQKQCIRGMRKILNFIHINIKIIFTINISISVPLNCKFNPKKEELCIMQFIITFIIYKKKSLNVEPPGFLILCACFLNNWVIMTVLKFVNDVNINKYNKIYSFCL